MAKEAIEAYLEVMHEAGLPIGSNKAPNQLGIFYLDSCKKQRFEQGICYADAA
jgi:predicted RNase H-like HicB family nuclease